jgi:indolepyruvate ferredoxin oxidoreductase beta subunit
MSRDITSVLICGVGGQGILLAGEILANVAMAAGLDAKKADVHGMAQRGGSVVSQVRFGPEVYSPLIPLGTAEVILSFEELEEVRYIDYLKPGGTCIINTQRILPITVATGMAEYPDDTIGFVKSVAGNVITVDALKLAHEAGDKRAVNTALLGVLANHLDLSEQAWQEGFKAAVKPKFLEMNLRAFELGRKVTG